LAGKTVIQRVFQQVNNIVDYAVVATDNQLIADEVKRFGGNVVMTSENHRSGTDRCCEAMHKVGGDFDVVINVQGDEPFIQHSQIEAVKDCFAYDDVQIATLVKPFDPKDGFQAVVNPNSPKVVLNDNMEAIFFSRSVIPYVRGKEMGDEWFDVHTFYKHIGIYAYKTDVLEEITKLQQSSLEIAESLEQLRWIQNGFKIKVGVSNIETIGIDTPQDLHKAEKFISHHPEFA
jgi:3-deoxy-manno-octulosonate cytidylyltransferase (CMP-KDO synthetase)